MSGSHSTRHLGALDMRLTQSHQPSVSPGRHRRPAQPSVVRRYGRAFIASVQAGANDWLVGFSLFSGGSF